MTGKPVMASLLKVQQNLKVPKDRNNSFGGYKYRSAEDILAAAKVLCCEEGLLLNLSDEILNIGSRFYVKATASVTDIATGDIVSAQGFAREEENKKGMDGSQITGASSSYARKYALNGLFALDDIKDADTDELRKERETRAKGEQKTKEKSGDQERQKIFAEIKETVKAKSIDEQAYKELLTKFNVTATKDLDTKRLAEFAATLKKM